MYIFTVILCLTVQVTKTKMWRGVALRMGIPPSCTNAGFLLRKHYVNFIEPYVDTILNSPGLAFLGVADKILQYKIDNAKVFAL